MKALLQSTKVRVLVVIILILLVFGTILVSAILKQEQQLPSKGWSRAINLKTTLAYGDYPYISEKNGDFYVFTRGKASVNQVVLDQKMNIIQTKAIPVKVPNFTAFWADGKSVVYVKDGQLIKILNGQKTTLASNVGGMSASNDKVIFWKSKDIYQWDPSTQKIQLLDTAPYPVDQVVTKRGMADALVISQTIQTNYVYMGYLMLSDKTTYHSLGRFDKPYNASLDAFDFLSKQGKINVVYAQFGSTTGGMYRHNYLDVYDQNTFKPIQKEEKLNIKNVQTQLTLQAPTNVRLAWKDNHLILLFEENSYLFRGESAQNIFLATLHGSDWEGAPISSTIDPSGNPVLLNSKTVIWNDLVRNQYTLMLGSQYPSIISKSYHLTQRDWGQAVSRALMNLTISVLMVGYAIMWAIPTGLFMFAMFFGFMTQMERNPVWVKVVGVGLFFITQILFIKSLFGATFHQFSPAYLQFPGNFIIIPALLMGGAIALTQWVKNEDWGGATYIFVCILFDVLMLCFLIGPFTI